MSRILVDMDGVLADTTNGFRRIWSTDFKQYPNFNYLKRKHFWLDDAVGNGRFKDEVTSVFKRPGFFLNLPVMPGAVDGINYLAQENEVYICTKPMTDFENCVLEKYQWVADNLGRSWTKRLILTKNKAIVDADYLIDDNPDAGNDGIHRWSLLVYESGYTRWHNIKAYTWTTLKEYFK